MALIPPKSNLSCGGFSGFSCVELRLGGREGAGLNLENQSEPLEVQADGRASSDVVGPVRMDATDGKSALTQRSWLLRVVECYRILTVVFSAGELHPDLSDGIKWVIDLDSRRSHAKNFLTEFPLKIKSVTF